MLIIKTTYFLGDFIFDGLTAESRQSLSVVNFERKEQYSRIAKWMTVNCHSGNPEDFYPSDYVSRIKRLAEEHHNVLLFGVENLKDVMLHRRMLPPECKFSVFLWNPFAAFRKSKRAIASYISACRKLDIGLYSFDRADASLDDYVHFVPQPYRFCPEENCPEENLQGDIVFVGADKGRGKRLAKFHSLCEKAGLKTYFYIMRSKHFTPPAEIANCYHDAPLPYDETLRAIRRHRAVLELHQPGQKGMSLRALEAMFNGRKLITDNYAIRDTELYHHSRVLLPDGCTSPTAIAEFIAQPYLPVSDQVLAKHDINNWIKLFE